MAGLLCKCNYNIIADVAVPGCFFLLIFFSFSINCQNRTVYFCH